MSTPAENMTDAAGLQERIARFQKAQEAIISQVRRVIVGQEEVIDQVMVALFVGGHCLITGLPGTAKTLLVRTLAQALGLEFRRIQFTPDLMPSDITGTDIIEEDPTTGRRTWTFVPGPIFSNVLLADEINRTPPKTQSALLEAMQERSCTVRGNQYTIRPPFFVLATQNPIELEGTYPLPEAQLDRFIFNVLLDYLSADHEMKVLDLTTTTHIAQAEPVTNAEEILDFQQVVRMVPIADSIARYAVNLVRATRATDPIGARFRQEVRQLRRQRPRRAVLSIGGQSPGVDEAPLSRDLRRYHPADEAHSAASHSAELPGRIRPSDAGRHLEQVAGGHARA